MNTGTTDLTLVTPAGFDTPSVNQTITVTVNDPLIFFNNTTVGDDLTISGQRARPELPEGSDVRRSERAFGRFRRSIRMPADVDVDRVGAKLENGVLRLTLPRRTGSQEHKVEIE